MIYCDNPEDAVPIFRLYDPIGFDETQPMRPYVDGNLFARELASLTTKSAGKESVSIYINCEGGSMKDGWSIWAAILESDCDVNTHVIGVAYSMAGVIALAGKKRTGLSTASWMYHMGYNPDATEDKCLNTLNNSMLVGVSERWGKPENEVERILKAETYYNADQAENLGLVQKGNIIHVNDMNAPAIATDIKAQRVFALAYYQKQTTKPTKMDKSQICAMLNLDPNVSDEYAMSKLKEMTARASRTIKVSAKKAEMDDDETDEDEDCSPEMKVKKAEKRAKAAEAKLDEMKAEQATAAAAEASSKEMDGKKAAAHAAITAKATERGLIFKTETINSYVALAIASEKGLETVIETIEAIPVTKIAADITKATAKAIASGAPLVKPEEKFVTEGVDKYGQPIVTNTDSFAAFMNAQVRANAKKRFNPNN